MHCPKLLALLALSLTVSCQPDDADKPAPIQEATKKPKQAPAAFRVKFETTVGDIVVECYRDWAPRGADRFFELVQEGFYEDIGFFRVKPGFVAQFGIHGDPNVSRKWRDATIPDDPVKASNDAGTLSFASAGPNTRTTQLFINFNNNPQLDAMGFAPFAKVVEGMSAVGEIYRSGDRPDQARIQTEGNAYLRENFRDLTWIKRTTYLGEVETTPK